MNRRAEILQALVRFEIPARPLMTELRALGWDWAGEPLLVIKKDDLLRVIDRFLAGDISAEQLQEWAENLEVRDDVAFEKKDEELLDGVFVRIATPETNEPLTPQVVRQMRHELLQEGGYPPVKGRGGSKIRSDLVKRPEGMKLPELKTYWFAWLAIVGGLILFKLVAPMIGLLGVREWLGFGYILGIWFPIMILSYFEQQPLRARIEEVRKTHGRDDAYSVWQTQLRVVFSGDTLGDQEIARLRRRQIGFLALALISLVLFSPIMSILSH